jgi:hypothetical protein
MFNFTYYTKDRLIKHFKLSKRILYQVDDMKRIKFLTIIPWIENWVINLTNLDEKTSQIIYILLVWMKLIFFNFFSIFVVKFFFENSIIFQNENGNHSLFLIWIFFLISWAWKIQKNFFKMKMEVTFHF